MKVIVLANQKGGVGKSTLVIHLAAGLAQQKKRVLVCDADPQNTSYRWSQNSKSLPFTVERLSEEKVNLFLQKRINDYDYCLVDCPPAAESIITFSACLVADLVVIPLLSSPPDLWASLAIKETLQKVLEINKEVQVRFCLNQYQKNLTLSQQILPLLKHLEFPVLTTSIGRRVAYAECAAQGQTVFQINNVLAQKEIKQLTNEIVKLL